MKNIVFLLLSLMNVGSNDIPYRKLTWNDFVKVKKLPDASAEVSTAISYDYETNKPVKVHCILERNKSFVETNSINDYILNHEQRHFDLTYIYSRKFAFLLKSEPNATEERVKEIYNNIIAEWDAEQEMYDDETDNSINKEKQDLWNRFIDNQLKAL